MLAGFLVRYHCVSICSFLQQSKCVREYRTHTDLTHLFPVTIFSAFPYLQFSTKCHACSDSSIKTRRYVVAPQLVHIFEDLYQRVRILIFGCIGVDGLALCAVDLDARRPRRGEKMRWRDGEGEYVRWVRIGYSKGLEVLFGHAACGYRCRRMGAWVEELNARSKFEVTLAGNFTCVCAKSTLSTWQAIDVARRGRNDQ